MSLLDEYAKLYPEAIWPKCRGCGELVQPPSLPDLTDNGQWYHYMILPVLHECGRTYQFNGFFLKRIGSDYYISTNLAQITEVMGTPWIKNNGVQHEDH